MDITYLGKGPKGKGKGSGRGGSFSPSRSRGQHSRGRPPHSPASERVCFTCQQVGHVARDCPGVVDTRAGPRRVLGGYLNAPLQSLEVLAHTRKQRELAFGRGYA